MDLLNKPTEAVIAAIAGLLAFLLINSHGATLVHKLQCDKAALQTIHEAR